MDKLQYTALIAMVDWKYLAILFKYWSISTKRPGCCGGPHPVH